MLSGGLDRGKAPELKAREPLRVSATRYSYGNVAREGSVTAMETNVRRWDWLTALWCGDDPEPDEVVYRVRGEIHVGRRQQIGDFLICADHWQPGGRSYRIDD